MKVFFGIKKKEELAFELLKMEKYLFNKEIGSGSFGKVFLVESRKTGIQYVLKQIDLNKLEKKQAQVASKEVEVLSKLRHRHVVRYKDSFEASHNLSIIMEYCENGDLHRKIKEKRTENKCFADDEIFDYFVQICLALEYIHEQKILHRDLKTKNIFLTKGNLIKLGDFGVAKLLENSFELANTCIGSPYYISPEICENKPYNKKSDIWALGCILYELTTLKYAFVAKNVKLLITKITSGSYNPLPVNVNAQIRSLLINLLKPNPKDRPTATEILNKQFMLKFKFKYDPDNCCSIMRRIYTESGKSTKLNNEMRTLSVSCSKLNDVAGSNKLKRITTPEMKYKGSFINNKFRTIKNSHLLSAPRKDDDGCRSKNFHVYGCKSGDEYNTNGKLKKKNIAGRRNFELLNIVKLPKVDSEYYNLIAESSVILTSERNNLEDYESACNLEKENYISKVGVNKQFPKSTDDIKINCNNYHSNEKIFEIENIEIEKVHDSATEEGQEIGECRRKWMANTLQKNQLVNLLSEAELIDITLVNTAKGSNVEKNMLTADDLLRLDPLEMSDDILLPIKIEDREKRQNNDHLIQLQEHIIEIKIKFEENEKIYDIKDLMSLTRRSWKILEMRRKCFVNEHTAENEPESIYFDLEVKRLQLEKTVGLDTFLTSYKNMRNILFRNIELSWDENTLPTNDETYIIHKTQDLDDKAKAIEEIWMSIIDSSEEKKQFIPDIWGYTVQESIYFQN